MNIPIGQNETNDSSHVIFRGRYQIYRNEIGSGSFARVYRARDIQTGNLVAIKKISLIGLASKLVERFHREMEIMRGLDHPNIVRFFDGYTSDRSIYLIMEYCNGGSFRKFHMNGEREFQRSFYQIFSALHYLHQNGITHRDIKPDNILISMSPDGTPTLKLTDFGFANYVHSERDMMTTVCGTPLYMSPELLRGQSYRSNSDVWSMGVILFEHVFQQYPFGQPKTMVELMNRIQERGESLPLEPNKPVSPELADLLKRLLETDYEQRIGYDAILAHPWFQLQFDDPDEDTIEEDIFDMDQEGFSSPEKITGNFSPKSTRDTTPLLCDSKMDAESSSISACSKAINIQSGRPIIEDFFKKPDSGSEMALSLSGSFGSLPTMRVGSNSSISPLFSYGWKKSVGAVKNILGTY